MAIAGCDSKETRAQTEFVQAIERNGAGDHAGCIAHLDQAIEYQPDFPEAYFRRGLARLSQSQMASALADFDEAIKWKPGSASYVLGRGCVLLSEGQYDAALRDLARVKQLQPSPKLLERADEVAGLAVRARAANAITLQPVSAASVPSSPSRKESTSLIWNGILGTSQFFARHPVWSIVLYFFGHAFVVHSLLVLCVMSIGGRGRSLTNAEAGTISLLSLTLGGFMFFLTWGFHHWILGTLCVVWSLAIGGDVLKKNSKK